MRVHMMSLFNEARGRLAALLTLLPLLVSCAATEPRISDPATGGPTARVTDWGGEIQQATAELYVLRAIDGQEIRTAIETTQTRGTGMMTSLWITGHERLVPARPMKATLLATVVTAKPLDAIAVHLSGRVRSAQGIVDFSPIAGMAYVVKAKLTPTEGLVWIEEEIGGKRVTEVVKVQKQ